MHMRIGIIAAVALSILASSVAIGENEVTREVSTPGHGTFTHKGHSKSIERASMELRENDRFTATFKLEDNRTIEVSGAVDGSGKHRKLSIKHGLGYDKASGHGDFTLTDNTGEIRDISAYGVVDGDQFSIQFEGGRDSHGGHGDRDDHHGDRDDHGHGDGDRWHNRDEFSFSENAAGSGKLKRGDDREDLSWASVHMSRNGDLHIAVNGPDMRQKDWTGRWRGDGPEYDIDLRQGDNGSGPHASGSIKLSGDRDALRWVKLEGKEHGDSFSLRFDAEEDEHDRDGAGDRDHDHADHHDDHSGDHSGGSGRSFSDDIHGSGHVKLGDDTMDISYMRIHMSRNGDLHLYAEGRHMSDTGWAGTWSGDGPDYNIELRKVDDGANVRASGTLKLSDNGKSFRSLKVEGRLHGDSFELKFKPE